MEIRLRTSAWNALRVLDVANEFIDKRTNSEVTKYLSSITTSDNIPRIIEGIGKCYAYFKKNISNASFSRIDEYTSTPTGNIYDRESGLGYDKSKATFYYVSEIINKSARSFPLEFAFLTIMLAAASTSTTAKIEPYALSVLTDGTDAFNRLASHTYTQFLSSHPDLYEMNTLGKELLFINSGFGNMNYMLRQERPTDTVGYSSYENYVNHYRSIAIGPRMMALIVLKMAIDYNPTEILTKLSDHPNSDVTFALNRSLQLYPKNDTSSFASLPSSSNERQSPPISQLPRIAAFRENGNIVEYRREATDDKSNPHEKKNNDCSLM